VAKRHISAAEPGGPRARRSRLPYIRFSDLEFQNAEFVAAFGGGGYYMGSGVGYYGGGGLSLVLLIVILFLLFGRGRGRL
jgi:hypothetical protein